MIIQRLSSDDVCKYRETLYKFMQMDFVQTYGKEADPAFVYSKLSGLESYLEKDAAFTLGAFQDDRMIGFLWGYAIDTPFEKVFHIAYIAVDENCRKMGIGKALINEVEKFIRDCDDINSIELIVGKRNENAVRFYEAIGFGPDRFIYRKFFD